MSSNVIECSCRKGDDDECLLIGDEKQFYQQMAKLSALRNTGMSSGHQPKFHRWSSVLLGEEAAHRCALKLGGRAVYTCVSDGC